ncbi:MAG: SAM-dependent methyltransferase [Pedobacter sp.]|nr:MAG: SAM-dependent methyltransferase [Pedobacter sp.]
MGNYKGEDDQLKNIYVRLVKIKAVLMLSFTFRYRTRDITKNFPPTVGIRMINEDLSDKFHVINLFTTAGELQLEILQSGKMIIRERSDAGSAAVEVSHDKQKHRSIDPDKSYLKALGITDSEGNVFKRAQDKYKQINHYIELLSPLMRDFVGKINHVADMGSGKGYLTFALYDYLNTVLMSNVKVTGVEFRQDLVDLCNSIANSSGFKQLDFIQGSIQSYKSDKIDMLIALHACDTATDDAIYQGIQSRSKLIIVAPCCHKQIRKQMENAKVTNDLSFLTRYGIFLERQAEMVTDGIRALILEYSGYKTKVFEFISDEHTPKNVLVVGIKTKDPAVNKKKELLQQIKETKAYFGIDHHHLEKLLNLNM